PHSSVCSHLFSLSPPPPPRTTLFPYTTLFRSRTTADLAHIAEGVMHVMFPRSVLYRSGGEPVRLMLEPGPGHLDLQRLKDKLFEDRKSTRLNSSHVKISYAVFCLKKKNKKKHS